MNIEYTFIFCKKPNKVEIQTFDLTIEWPVQLQAGNAVELSVKIAIAAKIVHDNPQKLNCSKEYLEKLIEETSVKICESNDQHPTWLLETDVWQVDHIYHRSHGDLTYQCTWVLISPCQKHPCR